MKPYVYKIRNKHNGKLYIGSQYGKNSNPDDFWVKYTTSSKIINENIEDYEVVYVKLRDDAQEYEARLLQRSYKFLGRERFLDLMINRNLAPGIVHDELERAKISERLRKRWASGQMDDVPFKSAKTRKSRTYNKIEMNEELKNQYSERMKKTNPMHNPEVKIKHKEKMNSKETKEKRSKLSKGNTFTKGRKWYNDGTQCKMLYECPEGWTKGRLNPHWNYSKKENNNETK